MRKISKWLWVGLLMTTCASVVIFSMKMVSTVYAEENETFTVDTTVDGHDAIPGDGACATVDGGCTLRAAIMEANALAGPQTIDLPAGTYTLTIAGTMEDGGAFGDLDITGDLTITGNRAEDTMIDGNGLDRVLHIKRADIQVVIEQITIQNGNTEAINEGGAGILNLGKLTIRNSIIQQNRTNPDTLEGRGGGIRNDGGTIIVEDSFIEQNQGQGLYAWFGEATIQRVTVQENNGEGLVYAIGNGILLVMDSQIISNTRRGIVAGAINIAHSTIEGNGGGMQIGSGTLDHITIRQNVTAENGGGLWVRGGDAMISMSTIVSNQSTASNGGGIHGSSFLDNSEIVIINSTIMSNTAVMGGGVDSDHTLRIKNAQIAGNKASQNGGGIHAATLYVNQSTLNHNQADSNGGAISATTLYVNNSTLSTNQSGGNGGAIYVGQTFESTAELASVTIVENSAISGTGGLHNDFGLVSMRNSILASNLSQNGASNECKTERPIISQGHNLIEDGAGCLVTGDVDLDLNGVAPLLGPLQDNGGPTLTHALLDDSPALDAGPATGCINTGGITGDMSAFIEQRGFLRAVDGNGDGLSICDIGAVEFGSRKPLHTFVPLQSSPSSSSATLRQPPTRSQVNQTLSTLGVGLAFGLVMTLGLGTLLMMEDDQTLKVEDVHASPSLD